MDLLLALELSSSISDLTNQNDVDYKVSVEFKPHFYECGFSYVG